MSAGSRRSYRAKVKFYRHLEKAALDAVEEQEQEQEQVETKCEYSFGDWEDLYPSRDDYERDDYERDTYDDYDDYYYYYDDLSYSETPGRYYKSCTGDTLLCCEIDGRIWYVSTLTGKPVSSHLVLGKIT